MPAPGDENSVAERQSPGRTGRQNRRLVGATWLFGALFVVAAVAFGAYYYNDRYIYEGDMSPLDRTIERLEQGVRDAPENRDIRMSLAEVYLGKGRYEDALNLAEDVLGIYEDDQQALLVAGIAYNLSDQPEAAIPKLRSFADQRKDAEMAGVDEPLERAYYYLGSSYLKALQPNEAIEALEAALAISRIDADALQLAGVAYRAAGQPEKAVEYLARAARLVPDFREAYAEMELAYAELGQPDHAAYAEAMQSFSTGQHDKALERLLRVTAAIPEFSPAFHGLGLAYEELGKLEEAEAALLRAVEMSGGDIAPRQALGRVQSLCSAATRCTEHRGW